MKDKKLKGERGMGRAPKLGYCSDGVVPRRFFLQVKHDDLQSIVFPPDIQKLVVEKWKLKKPKVKDGKEPKLCIPLRTTKCCEYFVQLRWFEDHLVIFKGWEDFAKEIKLDTGDVLVFKFVGDGFKVKLFRFISSTEEAFVCPVHGK